MKIKPGDRIMDISGEFNHGMIFVVDHVIPAGEKFAGGIYIKETPTKGGGFIFPSIYMEGEYELVKETK